jgi:hypothetical protein
MHPKMALYKFLINSIKEDYFLYDPIRFLRCIIKLILLRFYIIASFDIFLFLF